MNIWELHKDYEKTYLYPAMQRLGGFENGSGWDKGNNESFLGGLLEGTNGSEVLRLDLASAAKFVEDPKTLAWIEELMNERGMEYVVIDGNNTSSAIYHFFKGEVGARDVPDDPKSELKYFSDFDESERMQIMCLPITVWDVESLDRDQMTSLFRRLNKSTELNPQEKRQSRITSLAAFVRELANDLDANGERIGGNAFWQKFYSVKKCHTRIHEEQVAKFGLMLEKGFDTSTNPNPLDSFYASNEDFEKKTKNKMKRVLGLAEKIAKARISIENSQAS
jgi:hypothetical protein